MGEPSSQGAEPVGPTNKSLYLGIRLYLYGPSTGVVASSPKLQPKRFPATGLTIRGKIFLALGSLKDIISSLPQNA